MKRFLKLIASATALLVFVLAFAACGKTNVSDAKIDYGNSAVYSEEDMDEAIELIKKEFSAHMTGVKKLKNIRYASDECTDREYIDWMNELREANDTSKNPFTQHICFLTDFTTSDNTTSLNTNSTYTDWQWHLARTDGGNWVCMTSGY